MLQERKVLYGCVGEGFLRLHNSGLQDWILFRELRGEGAATPNCVERCQMRRNLSQAEA